MSLIPLLALNPYTWLIVSAIVPAVVLLVYVYKKDRLEKESTGLLLSLVFLGVLSTAFASFTEQLGIAMLPYFSSPGSKKYYLLFFFIVVGMSEEGFKYLLVRWKTWRSREFNCQFDGVVYAVFVSLGFALWENISYVMTYGFGTALVRAVTAVPGHTCFGVFMGAFYGISKKYELMGAAGESRLFRWLAFLVPVLLHGAYDYLASQDNAGYQFFFVAFVAALFFISFRTVKKLSEHDQYIR